MRLWHKDLISYLPRQQLLGQWRECCLIAKNIKEKGTPNHILVNKIMNYPLIHFYNYCRLVMQEMETRGYKCNKNKFWDNTILEYSEAIPAVPKSFIFGTWHNLKYLKQCYYNLQEKYDCGGISDTEWGIVQKNFWDLVANKNYK